MTITAPPRSIPVAPPPVRTRGLSALLHRTGAYAVRRPWRVLAAWVLAVVVAVGLAGSVGGALQDDYTMPGTDSQRATNLLRAHFPGQAGATARLVIAGADDPAAVGRVAAAVRALPHVVAVDPPRTGRGVTVLEVRYDAPVTDVDPAGAFAALERAGQPARDAGLTVEIGGEVPDNGQAIGGSSEVVGLVLAGVLLLIVFGSLVAAGLPLAIAVVGLGTGLALVTVLARATSISTIAPTVAAMVGIGAGIDYALFVVSRHRQQLLDGVPLEESVARANASSGRSVVFAGATVLVALCGLALSGVPNFTMIGVATGVVVAVSVAAAVTLLPALLGFAGTRVLPRRARRLRRTPSGRLPLTARWGGWCARHPWPAALGALVLLLLLAAPVLDMRLGQSDAGVEPTSNTTRRAYDLVAQGFGPGANGPLVVAADLAAGVDLDGLGRTLAAQPGVVDVQPAVLSPDGQAAVVTVVPATGPQDEATSALIERLRADVLPDGVSVTGPTAAFIDFNQRLQDRLPLVLGCVVGTSMLLLVLVFRSVVAPVKAAVMNLLSVGAAFGAVVALFQWGWGQQVLGLPGPVPVNAFVPMLMFAIVFGLSMDYEVFLLSRVREEWDRGHDARGSVVAGLAATGPVITSAAAIMVLVFVGFGLDDNVAIRMMGVGMAVAILVDATLVRLVLVPATMVLLGRWNWWLPGWLARALPASPRG